jgi:hypothetical protein
VDRLLDADHRLDLSEVVVVCGTPVSTIAASTSVADGAGHGGRGQVVLTTKRASVLAKAVVAGAAGERTCRAAGLGSREDARTRLGRDSNVWVRVRGGVSVPPPVWATHDERVGVEERAPGVSAWRCRSWAAGRLR